MSESLVESENSIEDRQSELPEGLRTLETVSEAERLVPDSFEMSTVRQIETFVKQRRESGDTFPGYPEGNDLMRLASPVIEAWDNNGRPEDWLQVSWLGENPHPNRVSGIERGIAFVDDGKTTYNTAQFGQSIAEGMVFTQRGLPIHPFYKELLSYGVPGGFAPNGEVWAGFYWGAGPNKTADPCVTGVRMEEGDLYFSAILIQAEALAGAGLERTWGMPGGMVDPGELENFTAVRELAEEAGVEMDNTETIEMGKAVVIEPRTGLTAWPETTVVRVHLGFNEARKISPVGGDDARKAGWRRLSEEVFNECFSPTHVEFFKLAVKAFQDENPGLVVGQDGRIGLREGLREDKVQAALTKIKDLIDIKKGDDMDIESINVAHLSPRERFKKEMDPDNMIENGLIQTSETRADISAAEFEGHYSEMEVEEKDVVGRLFKEAARSTVDLLEVTDGKILPNSQVLDRNGYGKLASVQHVGYVARQLGEVLGLSQDQMDKLSDELWGKVFSLDGTDSEIRTSEERVGQMVGDLDSDLKQKVSNYLLEKDDQGELVNGWLINSQISQGSIVANMPGFFAGKACEGYANWLMDKGQLDDKRIKELLQMNSQELSGLVMSSGSDSADAKLVRFGIMAAQQGWQLVNARDGKYQKAKKKNLYHSFEEMVEEQGDAYWGQVIKDWDQVRSYFLKGKDLSEGVFEVDRDKN